LQIVKTSEHYSKLVKEAFKVKKKGSRKIRRKSGLDLIIIQGILISCIQTKISASKTPRNGTLGLNYQKMTEGQI